MVVNNSEGEGMTTIAILTRCDEALLRAVTTDTEYGREYQAAMRDPATTQRMRSALAALDRADVLDATNEAHELARLLALKWRQVSGTDWV